MTECIKKPSADAILTAHTFLELKIESLQDTSFNRPTDLEHLKSVSAWLRELFIRGKV